MSREKKKIIRGAGGGGGGNKTPTEATDNLKSSAYARLVDLICEGEVEGLVDGLKSVYLDETPIENEDGTRNFSGVTVETRNGTNDQTALAGFSSIESEITVGVDIRADDGPTTRQITNPEIDAVRLRISIPALTFQQKDGDIVGTSVRFKIEANADGGPYFVVVDDTITGKTTSRFEKTYRVNLQGDPPWNIRVRRITEDSTSASLNNKTVWDSYTEIIDAKLRYPNSAIVGVRVEASQFQSVPARAYDMKLLRIQVPSNYDPDTREYDGVWDGEFQVLWSDNPAWVFYDILTNERYGLGRFLQPEQVDKWALYEIAQYCDELVDDGFGALEPRFTCNIFLQSREEAYKVLQDLASVFRGITYWSGGAVVPVQDAPRDPVALFTPSNVIEGSFVYQGASAKARHTVALVSWNDPDDLYRRKIEYVEDVEAIAQFGIVETEIVAIGCTSRGQANRVGKWLIFSEQNESETVIFKTGVEGSAIRPGDIIQIADPVRAGARRGGRIVSATTTQVTIDEALTGSTSGISLSVVLPNGTVETKTVTGILGVVISVAQPFSVAPNSQSIWMVSSTTIEAQTFRVVSCTETDDGQIEVSALKHIPQKYEVIEEGVQLEPSDISDLSLDADTPQNVQLTESLYESSSDVKVKLTVSWRNVAGAVGYIVSYQKDNGNFVLLPETSSTDVDIFDVLPGFYTARVIAVSAVGRRSEPAEASTEVFGKILPPNIVFNFSMIPMAGNAYLSWSKAVELDVLKGGSVRIRHTPRITAQSWIDAVDILPALPGNATRATAPLLAGTYMAKFIDSSGVASPAEAIIVTTVPEALALNVIDTLEEHPAWAGDMVDVAYSGDLGGIVILDGTTVDELGMIDDLPSFDFPTDVFSVGTYYFTENPYDLGAVYSSRVTAFIEAEAFDVTSLIDFRTQLMDDWTDFDGTGIDDVNAVLYMRTTEDDPSGSPEWTDWKPFFVGEYKFRSAEFKIELLSESPQHNIILKALGVVIDMPDRVENLPNLTSGATTLSVSFANPFRVAPAIAVTAENLSSGDYWEITSKSESGFDIIFRDSSHAAIIRNFDVLAKGYGRVVV